MNKDYWMLLYSNPAVGVVCLLGIYTAVQYFFRFMKFLFSEEAKDERDYKIINLKIFLLRVLICRKVIWYLFLLMASGIYSVINWSKVSIFKPLTGEGVIFIVFVVLALSPLFKKVGINDYHLEFDLGIMTIGAQKESLQKLIKERDNKAENRISLSPKVTKDIKSIEEQVKDLRKKEETHNV